MAVTVHRYEQAPAELRALSDHGGDEDWVIIGDRYDADPRYMADFCYVVETMDKYDFGSGTIHLVDYDGRPVMVYIIAHA